MELKPHEEPGRPARITGILFFIGLFAFVALTTTFVLDRVTRSITNEPLFSVLRGFILSPDTTLRDTTEDRVNVLLLGIGGTEHEGGNLTDTIIVASVRPSTGEAALLGIPRDLSIPTEQFGWIKVNAIHAFAEAAHPGSGPQVLRDALGTVLEIPIPYHLRIDFQGFASLIDTLGGVTITVENTIDDPRYPIAGREEAEPYESRFEHLVIPAGERDMNGALALKYVRSRYARGIEGSDFARLKRQQRVLLAIKREALSLPTLLNPLRIDRILSNVEDHLETNLTMKDIIRLSSILRDVDPGSVRRISVSDAPESVLRATLVEGAYVLLPREGSFAPLVAIAHGMLDNDAEASIRAATASASVPAPLSRPSVEVLNGTWTAGLAATIAESLTAQGFDVIRTGNASIRPVPTSTIYRQSEGADADAERRLELFLGATMSAIRPNTDTLAATDPTADFLIILGEDTSIAGVRDTRDALPQS